MEDFICKVSLERCGGFEEAMFGLGFNMGKTSSYSSWYEMPEEERLKIFNVAKSLAKKDGGHNKFLESICLWVDLTLPRYVWSEADTYRIGMTKQSQSTMHTLVKELRNSATNQDISNMFEPGSISEEQINVLKNIALKEDSLTALKKIKKKLPEGFLQRRMCCFNMKTFRTIAFQRVLEKEHRLPHWKMFYDQLSSQIKKYNPFVGELIPVAESNSKCGSKQTATIPLRDIDEDYETLFEAIHFLVGKELSEDGSKLSEKDIEKYNVIIKLEKKNVE